MPLAITVIAIELGEDFDTISGTLTASGAYVTGGDTLDWTTVAGAQVGTRIFMPAALPGPVFIGSSDGYGMGYVAGTTLANGKVKMTSSSNTEISASAYPSGISGDTNIYFTAKFPSRQ